MLEVREVPGKGRGLVTSERIVGGSVIDRSETLAVSPADAHKIAQTKLGAYLWSFDRERVIALGRVAFCNHDQNPNARASQVEGAIILTAVRDIAPGEEVTIFYGKKDQ